MFTPNRRAVCTRFAVSIGLVLAAMLLSAAGGTDDFVVIRNASNDLGSMSRDDLYKIYTGGTKLFGGGVAQAVIGKEDSGELLWLAGLFDMRPKDLLTKIKQQVFSGEMRRPIVAKTQEEAVAAVQNNRGGVAVVAASAVSSLPSGVAVLSIQ